MKTKVDSYEVFHWPEFRAFAERLGVPLGKPIRSLTVHLAMGQIATYSLELNGEDTSDSIQKAAERGFYGK